MRHANFSRRERAAIAFATLGFVLISAFVHFALGGYIGSHLPRWAAPLPDQSPQPFIVEYFPKPRPTPTPPPVASPKPQPTNLERPSPPKPNQHPIRPRPPVTHSSPDPGRVDPSPQPQSSANPEPPVPSPTPNVDGPVENRDPISATAATFKHKLVPEYPRICVDEGAGGRVTVEVTINGDGSVAAAWVGQTSGFACLDAAALAAAKESTYNAPEVGGRPVAETYIILYEFSIDS
jgi:periplasmic protein TonB